MRGYLFPCLLVYLLRPLSNSRRTWSGSVMSPDGIAFSPRAISGVRIKPEVGSPLAMATRRRMILLTRKLNAIFSRASL